MSMRPSVEDLILTTPSTIRAALESLNRTAAGIVLLVDQQRKLCGVLTDGDIRRAMLSGATLDGDASAVSQTAFVSLPVSTDRATVLQTLNHKIRIVPLTNERGEVVDYASFDHLHWMPVMEPSLGGNEMKYVVECINTNWISSQGRFVTEFERQFEQYLGGGRRALTVMNGTVALHLALVTLGIGPGDEVLVPDLTFAACANAVMYTGAIPVLVDVCAETWTMDPEAAEAAITPRTRAIMPVHLYGHPADMGRIGALAQRYGLLVVEDAAEAVGAKYRGTLVGNFGHAACFSFFGNKIITSGEGGMIVFANESDWERARMLRDHGMSRDRRYWHVEIGFNYRMTNLQAAIGLAQLERIDDILLNKQRVSSTYTRALAGLPWVVPPPVADWAENVHWLYTVLVDPSAGVSRDEVLQKLQASGIESRPIFFPLHDMPPYAGSGRGGSFTRSRDISQRGISLPSAQQLDDDEVLRVVDTLQRIQAIKTLLGKGESVSL